MMLATVTVPPADRFVYALRESLRARVPRRTEIPEFRPAAVLVPVVVHGGVPRLVFTLRSEAMPTHSGQVSFPGGKVDAGDADRAATALREAEEEVGLARARVEVIGALDEVATPSRFVITPVVGLVAEGPPIRVTSGEVAETFEVSLEALRAPGVFRDHGQVEREGRTYHLVAYQVDGRNIWGATARMVLQLLSLTGG